MSEETLLLAIETLYQKVKYLTASLWDTEKQLIDVQNVLKDKDNELAYLRDCVRHRDEEIEDLYGVLEASQNLDRLSKMQEENLKLLKNYEDSRKEYNQLHGSIKHLYDIDYTM